MIHHVDIECPAGTSACCNQSKFKKVAKVHKGLSWYIKTIIQCLKKSTLKTIDISQLIGVVGIDHPICIGPAYISSIKMMSTKENYAIGGKEKGVVVVVYTYKNLSATTIPAINKSRVDQSG